MNVPALERCVGDVRRFAEEHWGRQPLFRHAGADAFAGLLDLADVDHLLGETLLRMPAFRLVKDGVPLDAKTYTQTVKIGGERLERTVRPDRVADAFADGATIVLNALHRQSGPIGDFCRRLELELTHPVQANAYITPPTARGFSLHHDTHDVFVLQTRGHKAWRVYPPLVELAGPDQPWKESLGDPGEPVLTPELGPGDALYIPRGFPHAAEAQTQVSVHITIGIMVSTWADVWRGVMKRVSEERTFRDALPIGYAEDPEALAAELDVKRKELHAWLDETGRPEALQSHAERFWRSRRPLSTGRLTQLQLLDEIDAATRARRRAEGVFRVASEDETVTVSLGSREVRMPSFCEPALRFIADAPGAFAASDLPGLDEASRVVLVKRLVREGALEVES